MRFDISYTTRFEYEADVAESQNELRAAPASYATQHTVHYDVRTVPSSRVFSYTDYWGTRVDAFGIRAPHRRLVVVASATVETSQPAVLAASPRMSELTAAFCDERVEFLAPSPHSDWGPGIEALADAKRREVDDDLVGLVLAFHRTIGTTCEYRPGETYVGVDVETVLEQRSGVCQDFAHLLIALCRAAGIPARYVSGFLFTGDDAVGQDVAGDHVRVQTHAWVEVAVPGFGWWGLDPTNRQEVGQRHVKIGHGRDYDDVAPMRGVYLGPSTHRLEVEVDMHRASITEASITEAQQQQQQ